jgi:hypothetical protein
MTPTDMWMAIRRGWWLVLGVPLVAAAVMFLIPGSAPQVVQARLSLALDVPADLVVPTSDAGAAKVGETLIDDISRVIGGDVFAAAVADRLGSGGTELAAGAQSINAAPTSGEIASSLSATDRHRTLDITVTRSAPAGTPPDEIAQLADHLTAVAGAAAEELTANGGAWFALLGADSAGLTLVDGPDAGPLPPSLRERLETPVRLAAAAALGIALALALWAIDPRVRSAADATAATRTQVLGAVTARWNP